MNTQRPSKSSAQIPVPTESRVAASSSAPQKSTDGGGASSVLPFTPVSLGGWLLDSSRCTAQGSWQFKILGDTRRKRAQPAEIDDHPSVERAGKT
jgi:hypothetical protein